MGKKIGYFFLSLTPALMCVALQILVGVVICFCYAFMLGASGEFQANPDMNFIMQKVAMDTGAPSVFAYHILGIIVFGIWYYFGCGKRKPASIKTIANAKFLGTGILSALIFITLNYIVVYTIAAISPETIEAYNEMWENMALGNGTLLTIATVFLAPVGEELLLRGLTLYYAQQCTRHFWVANTIQAFLFGAIHMNIIQGTYAFIGGLLLGWLYKKYNSLYIVILVHFLVNLSAVTWADPTFAVLFENPIVIAVVSLAIIGIFLGVFAWNGGFQKKKSA